MSRNTVFSQLLQIICQYRFKKCVDQFDGDKYAKRFSCWQQLIVLLFAQAKGLGQPSRHRGQPEEPPSEVVSSRAHQRCKKHFGDANAKRNADIFRDVFYTLLEKCRELAPKHKFKFKNPLYTFDSTLVSVCLSLFSWAKYRKKKGAFKLHTLLDHNGYLPSFIVISDGKTHDINVVKDDSFGFPKLSPDSILLVDRAYIDYNWLYLLTQNKLFFVTKAKSNMKYEVLGQQNITKNKGVISDSRIRLVNFYQSKAYPKELRLITYIDRETGEKHVFLTNNFVLAAKTIADLYKSRWELETFFKWIKQNLKIKSFLGTSKNAVMTQIWAAMIYYLLLSFIKFQTKCRHSLHELTRIVGELLLDNVYLIETLTITFNEYKRIKTNNIQSAFW